MVLEALDQWDRHDEVDESLLREIFEKYSVNDIGFLLKKSLHLTIPDPVKLNFLKYLQTENERLL